MACSCKCCCGCCCDGETGEQKLGTACTSPKEFKGKGTSCDVCCDLGEIREDITEAGECPGTWVVNGRCLDNPCASVCETDEDCPSRCPDGMVDTPDGEVILCCPPGHTIDNSAGDCRPDGFTGPCTEEDCPPSFTQIPSYCCDGQCTEEPCDP